MDWDKKIIWSDIYNSLKSKVSKILPKKENPNPIEAYFVNAQIIRTEQDFCFSTTLSSTAPIYSFHSSFCYYPHYGVAYNGDTLIKYYESPKQCLANKEIL